MAMTLFRLLLGWPLIAFLILMCTLRLYKQHHRLSHVPGPWGSGFSSLWIVYAVLTKRAHLEFTKINKIYGSVARIGANSLITTSPELIFHMNDPGSRYIKSDWYIGARLEPGRDHLFSQIDEKHHSLRRRQLASGYSGKENPDLEESIDSIIGEFVSMIRSRYISDDRCINAMDLSRKSQFFTLDVITRISFGEAFGNLAHDQDMYNYLESSENAIYMVILLCSIPFLRRLFSIDSIANLAFPSGKESTGPGRIIGVAKDLLSKRYGSNVQRQDMIGSFIRHGLDEKDLVSECLLQILAGSETTATTIRVTMLYLMSHPSTYRKLQEEVDDAVRSGKASSPFIKNSEALNLPYLWAVIKEGLRIWPPATGLLPKVVPVEGDTVLVDGKTYILPGGTDICWNSWALLRHKDVFGQDSDYFRPERWLEAKGEKLAYMLKVSDLVFGWGKYQCLGRNIAWMELNKCLFELFRNFNFSIAEPAGPWKSDNVGLWRQTEEWVEITDRVASG